MDEQPRPDYRELPDPPRTDEAVILQPLPGADPRQPGDSVDDADGD